jgi:hypothetical protein
MLVKPIRTKPAFVINPGSTAGKICGTPTGSIMDRCLSHEEFDKAWAQAVDELQALWAVIGFQNGKETDEQLFRRKYLERELCECR